MKMKGANYGYHGSYQVKKKHPLLSRPPDRTGKTKPHSGSWKTGPLGPQSPGLEVVVVQDKDKRQELSAAARGQAFVAQASVVIAACGTETEYIMTCGQHCYPIDVTIAMDHMSLMATDLGLGSCWIGAFYEDQVKQILGIPENVRVETMLTLGYPAEAPAARPRKRLDEIVAYDAWRN